MENAEKNMLQIGEVTKALGITRRMLINYENLGLVTPALKNEGHGFRFYSADNVVHIKLIRSLQNLGLSLPEIRSYFDDTVHLNEQIERLVLLRNQLDQYIAQLRLRQSTDKELKIHKATLPAFTAYCRDFSDADIATKTAELRNTYMKAATNYQIDPVNKICLQNAINTPQSGCYIIPVIPESIGENIKEFPQIQSICIYFRGAYECFPEVHEKLLRYAEEKGMTPHGYFRHIYMEGPPTHGKNKNAYITQIALPIKFVTDTDAKNN